MIHVTGILQGNVKRLLSLNRLNVVKLVQHKVSLLKEYANLFIMELIAANMIVLIKHV